MKHIFQTISFSFLVSFTATAIAQTVPDAGRILQQELHAPRQPLPSAVFEIPSPDKKTVRHGGARVQLKQVRFTGNSIFSQSQLTAVLKYDSQHALDLADLQSLASRITRFYRSHGYPFATAYLPAQKLTDGVLTIAIVEGRYGEVKAKGNDHLATGTQRFLSNLKPGKIIEMSALQRTLLILHDLPGIRTHPVIRPGRDAGTGELIVKTTRQSPFSGKIGGDNQGNRFTGEYRIHTDLQWNSPFSFGDQINLSGFISNQRQWMGDINYNRPLGTDGLQGQIDYSHTHYRLGKQFRSLDANGSVDSITIGAGYPLIRAQQHNLFLNGAWQHKKLLDKQDAIHTRNNKYSDVLPLTLRFDLRDDLIGGGQSYGSLTWTAGTLHLDAALKATDVSSAKTDGHFSKWTVNVTRIQSTPFPKLTLYAHLSGQIANKNLDSSEEFGLGGPYAVRAYPVGEGFGDEGWFAQVEARYRMNHVTPYMFYDAGRVRINKTPWTTGNNHRSIAGAGIGLRYRKHAFNIEVSLAWRTRGGASLSDSEQRNPRGWLTASWDF